MRLLLAWFGLLAFAADDSATLLADAEKLIQADRFVEARPLLERALRSDANNTEIRYRLGYTWFRLNNFEAARAQFRAVIRAAPPAPHSRYFLGRMALLENRPAEAVEWLKTLSVFDAESQLALAYAAQNQPEKALPNLKAALAKAPWDSNLHYRLGRLLQQSGQSELAADSLATATRLKEANRDDVAFLMQIAAALGQNNTSEAIRLGGGIKLRPQPDPDSLVALGVLLGGAGLDLEAIGSFVLAVERKSDHFQAQFNLGLALLRSGRTLDAFGPLTKAMELLPQSAEASLTYGLACVISQRYQDAVPPLQRAWNSNRTNPRAGSLLATALLRTGEPAQAAATLRSAVNLPDADVTAHLLLVEALNSAQDQSGALTAALTAARTFPKEPRARMAAAQQLARVGRYQDARPEFERVLAITPGYPEAELGLADCQQKAAQHEAAVGHYRLALAAASTTLAARTGLARSLLALGRLEEARALLEEGIAREPASPALRLELARVLARMGQHALAAEQSRIATELKKQ
jgi:tetratricopeptide (TPR) repeat protein